MVEVRLGNRCTLSCEIAEEMLAMKPNYKSQLCTDARMGPLLCIARCENIPLFNSSTQFVQQTVTILYPIHSAELLYKLLKWPGFSLPGREPLLPMLRTQVGGQWCSLSVCLSVPWKKATGNAVPSLLKSPTKPCCWEFAILRTCCKTQLHMRGLGEANGIDQHYLEEGRGFCFFFYYFSW